jgi:hypothetical protein
MARRALRTERDYLEKARDALEVSVPRIVTPRLLLREFRTTDFEAFAANLADPSARGPLPVVD